MYNSDRLRYTQWRKRLEHQSWDKPSPKPDTKELASRVSSDLAKVINLLAGTAE